MRRATVAAIALLVLAGCASPDEEPTPVDSGIDPAALVSERYGDCLAELDATDPVADDERTTVTATAEGVILTWDVGEAPNTGDPLTVPADQATLDALESVGC